MGIITPNLKNETAETEGENKPAAADEIIKDLLGKSITPKFKIEKPNKLTQAVYEDFVFSKLKDMEDSEFELNREFIGKLLNKDGKFENNEKNRVFVKEYFGEDKIKDFGQSHVAARIAAIGNIQKTKDYLKLTQFKTKDGETIFGTELKEKLPTEADSEIEKLANEYGGKRGKKNKYFNFETEEDRNNFATEAESYLKNLSQKNSSTTDEESAVETVQTTNSNLFSENFISSNSMQLLKDINTAMGAPADKKSSTQQAAALLRIFENPNLENMTGRKIDLPQEIKTSLERNDLKAIETAQQILNGATNIPLPKVETAPTKKLNGLSGKISTVATDNGQEYGVKYRVVDAKDLITSHKISGNNSVKNEKYPQELQPREREERVTMNLQPFTMASNLNPNNLLESRNLNQGAPVVRNDGIVLNGNGRTMAINLAYETGKAENYRRAILDNAEKFGFNRGEVEKMAQPVLVREVTNSLDKNDVLEIINSTAGGAMTSASEKAKVDAQKISEETFEKLINVEDTSQMYDTTLDKNQPFLSGVLYDVTNPNEINSYLTRDGEISSDGLKRVQNALSAFAYRDDDLIARMSESKDDNIKNLTEALKDVAPEMANLQRRMNNGSLYNYEVAKNITAAISKINELRNKNLALEDYFKQTKMFDEDTPEMQEILKFLDANKTKKGKVAQFLKEIASGIEAQGTPDNEAAFDFGEEYKKPQPESFLKIIK